MIPEQKLHQIVQYMQTVWTTCGVDTENCTSNTLTRETHVVTRNNALWKLWSGSDKKHARTETICYYVQFCNRPLCFPLPSFSLVAALNCNACFFLLAETPS